MSKLIDLSGKIFGRLKVIRRHTENNRDSKPLWVCLCQCGSIVNIRSYALQSGNTRSCGCLRNEISSKNGIKHHDSKSKEYNAWASLKARCYNTKDIGYKNYGGRGIKICDRWLNSYKNFLEDMGRAPSDQHSLDRKDTHGNYEKDNCRWATRKVQARNKRNNVYIKYNGNSISVAEFNEIIGHKYSSTLRRINAGWPIEKIASTPPRKCQSSPSR